MRYLLSLPFIYQILLVYLICVNIATFFWYGIDKLKSQANARRVPEKTLWMLALLGGSVGALCAMQFFHHKTRKQSFQAVLFIIFFVQVGTVLLLLQQNPSA